MNLLSIIIKSSFSTITIKFLPLYLISMEIKLPIFHPINPTFSKYGFQIAYITSMFESIYQHLLCTLSKAEKINLWHRRLGHFNISKILNKLSKINIPSKCQICSHSKLKDFPHKNSTNKSKGIFELIPMDLIGPIEESLHT